MRALGKKPSGVPWLQAGAGLACGHGAVVEEVGQGRRRSEVPLVPECLCEFFR